MTAWRLPTVAALALALAPAAPAQTRPLTETPKAGDCSRVRIDLTLSGKLKVFRDGKESELPIPATAAHRFVDRVLEVGSHGRPTRVARHYEEARSSVTVEGAPAQKALHDDRRLAVAQRPENGSPLAYSPKGPLTREELEL